MKENKIKRIKEYIMMNVGLVVLALGLDFFLIPARIAAGGVSGLATITYNLWKIPPGMFMVLCNVPLFIVGIKIFGRGYGFKTLFATIMLSVYTDLFSLFIDLEHCVTDNTLLAALYGGILTGVGIGIIMRIGGSTGGTDIIGQVLNKYFKVPVGYAMMMVDSVVIMIAASIFGIESALYAIIALYTAGRTINLILDGVSYSKVAYIISDEYEKVREIILEELVRGGTVFYSKGLYTNNEKNVIMTVVRNRDIHDLKEKVEKIDKKAFIIISEVHEVLGEGFKPLSKES